MYSCGQSRCHFSSARYQYCHQICTAHRRVVSAAGCGRGILKSRNAIFSLAMHDPHQGRQRRAARPPYDPRRSLGREMANRD
jgi:hypothetical protein